MRSLLIIFLLTPWLLAAQEIVPISGSDLPDAIVFRTEHFDQEGLFGYLQGGGADLCVELGFGNLLVQEIGIQQERLRLEVYRMATPEAAFGLYSLSVVQCPVRDSLFPFDCTGKYTYQAAHGRDYISVTSESGSGAAVEACWRLAVQVIRRNIDREYMLPDPFDLPRFRESRKNLVFTCGTVGLQNSLFPWIDLFTGVHFRMHSIILPARVADIYFARITFRTERDLNLFLGYAGLMGGMVPIHNVTNSDGLYREFEPVSAGDPLTIYFLESQEPYPIQSLLR